MVIIQGKPEGFDDVDRVPETAEMISKEHSPKWCHGSRAWAGSSTSGLMSPKRNLRASDQGRRDTAAGGLQGERRGECGYLAAR